MAELFGFSIQRASKDVGPREKTFTDPTPDDGAIEVAGGGFFSSVLDTDGRERSDLDLIRRYRDISMQSECDAAIEDIVNEGIISNLNDIPVNIDLTNLPILIKLKDVLEQNFMKFCDFSILMRRVMTFFVVGISMVVCTITKLLIQKTRKGCNSA